MATLSHGASTRQVPMNQLLETIIINDYINQINIYYKYINIWITLISSAVK